MHKSEHYGKILLKQNDKQSKEQIKNFASKLAKFLPYSIDIVVSSLVELLDNEVLKIEGDYLIQKRMVKDNLLSEKRANSGKKGGDKTAEHFAKAKTEANSENENESEDDNDTVSKKEETTQFQILEPEEILNRLKHSEYQVQEFLCRTYRFSAENYAAAVEMFVGEKTAGANELQKDYPEVVGQFKSWVKFHSQKLKKHFENGEAGTGKQRTTGHNITGVVDAADSILAAAASKLGT